jgi:hypothetical protein
MDGNRSFALGEVAAVLYSVGVTGLGLAFRITYRRRRRAA